MFTLRGVGGCGKTSNIKNIADWVMTNYTHHINHGITLTSNDIFGILEINKLKIGFVSAGDNLGEVKRNDDLLKQFPDLDVLVNACRTRGKGRQYLQNNYTYANGWLIKNIFIEKYPATALPRIASRDARVFIELQTWLTGLEKI